MDTNHDAVRVEWRCEFCGKKCYGLVARDLPTPECSLCGTPTPLLTEPDWMPLPDEEGHDA